MSPNLFVVASIRAKRGHEATVEQALREVLAPSRGEDGCIRYDLHRVTDDPRAFFMLEVWRDEDALERHRGTPHYARLHEQIDDHVEAGNVSTMRQLG